MSVIGDASAARVEIAICGSWSPQLDSQVTDALRLCLAGPSVSIIADLQHLSDPHGESMPFWLAAWRRARLETSSVQLAFSMPATAALSRRLRHLEGPQPRVFETVPEARAAIAERMVTTDRLQARLEPRPTSVRAARELVARACHAWNLHHQLRQDALIIVSELAANAVQHARTDFIVTLSRTGTRLHVAVHDGATRFPPPHRPAIVSPLAPLDDRGRGLRLVHAIAAAWGAVPTRGGKVVWATLT